MGGLALKNTFTRRYQRDEFEHLWVEMSAILTKTFKDFSMPRFFHSKESFGDMDIILSMEGFNQNMREYIEETFAPNEIFHNGHSWSFDYKELQVDFITCASENYNAHEHYFAFNDLGNFIGRIAQSIGLKYGQEGLWYNHFFKDQKVGKIIVSQDYPRIFEFLDLDYEQFCKGFDSLEEIFEYVTKSKFFSGHMYQLDQLNRINRERNLKRASYMSFLEFIDEKVPLNAEFNQDFTDSIKENIIKIAADTFPESNIITEVRRLEYEECKKLYASSKFNGHIAMEKYGISGAQLGNAMKEFKADLAERYPTKTYTDVIIELSEYQIHSLFNQFI